MEELKPNSHKYREENEKKETEPKKKVEPVVSGKVRTKKKGLFQKAVDLIIPEDIEDVRSHMIEDVLVPCFKDTISDVVNVILFGEKRSGSRGGGRNGTKVSYRDYYDNKNNRRDYNQVRARSSYELAELIFDSRGEALDVLRMMDDIIDRYGTATVADYYELSNVQANYTDNKYGWKNIERADTVSVRGGGFTIRMPRPLPLD